MSEFTEPAAIVALAATVVALAALIWCVALALRLRNVRSAQRVILGTSGQTDLVTHGESLQAAFTELRDRVEDVATRLEQRVSAAEAELAGAVTYRALVRYDAYGELSGHQSTSLALLDARRNGVVLSSIAHRETARFYCKQVIAGRGEYELSPEEDEAIRRAIAGQSETVVL